MYADSFRVGKMKGIVFLMVGIGGGIVCLAAGELPPALFAGAALLAFTLLISALGEKTARNSFTPLTLFFWVAAAHALLAYLLAGPASGSIWIGGRIGESYDPAFLIVTVFLFFASIGYFVSSHFQMPKWQKWCGALNISDPRLLRFARILVVVGSLLTIGIYWHLGYAPILSENPGSARFTLSVVGQSEDALWSNWLVNRAVDILTCSIPFVACFALHDKRFSDRMIALFGLAALVIPLRRENIVAVLLVIGLIQMLQKQTIVPFLLGAALLFAMYVASQVAFSVLGGGSPFSMRSPSEVLGSAILEVRDLGWVISLFNRSWFYGLTFIQPFVLVPSFMSDFWQRYSLGSITKQMIGQKEADAGGGLRITLAGESYLNFGYFGPVFVGIIFGVLCRYLDVAMQKQRSKNSLGAYYVVSMGFGWLCYFLYLSGSGAGATVKVSAAIAFLMIFLSRKRRGIA